MSSSIFTMNKLSKYLYLQTLTILGGTIFAYYNVFLDFKRYYAIESTIFKFTDCAVTNPLTISCFYGAFAFLLSLLLSLYILKIHSKNPVKSFKYQKYLVYLLIFGTLFGFANVGYEYYKFLNSSTGQYFGCTGVLTESPLQTPCFYGSVLFTLSLVISLVCKHNFRIMLDENTKNLSD